MSLCERQKARRILVLRRTFGLAANGELVKMKASYIVVMVCCSISPWMQGHRQEAAKIWKSGAREWMSLAGSLCLLHL
jgi:hypothetical protein